MAKAKNTRADKATPPKQDTLDFDELSPVIKALFKIDPELRALVEQGQQEGWFDPDNQPRGEQLWQNALAESNWYKENASSVRDALTTKATDPAEWERMVDDGRASVLEYASQQGLTIPEGSLDELAEQYVMSDWSNRPFAMRDALTQYLEIDYGSEFNFRGAAGDTEEKLRRTATRNGLTFNDSWYQGAVKAVQSGLTQIEDYDRDIREQAATYWTAYGDKILAGQDMMDLASGYMRILAETHEMDYAGISLNNQYIKHALMNVDENGNARPMGMWDFESYLRNQPEWMGTKQARDSVTSKGVSILERMGVISSGGTY